MVNKREVLRIRTKNNNPLEKVIRIPEEMRNSETAIILTLLSIGSDRAYRTLQRYEYNFMPLDGVIELFEVDLPAAEWLEDNPP